MLKIEVLLGRSQQISNMQYSERDSEDGDHFPSVGGTGARAPNSVAGVGKAIPSFREGEQLRKTRNETAGSPRDEGWAGGGGRHLEDPTPRGEEP